MSIHPRLRPPQISAEEMKEYLKLCGQIEEGIDHRDDVSELLAVWNSRASRVYTRSDFRYHGAIDMETFVTHMLLGSPQFVPDLVYEELQDVLDAVLSVTLSEAETSYYLSCLEANLPGANISDLIYWPNIWFANEDLLPIELSPDQLLTYAMRKCGRVVPGAPTSVDLPYPIPLT